MFKLATIFFIYSTTRFALIISLQASINVAPYFASSYAVYSPRPVLAPVIKMHFPFKLVRTWQAGPLK